MGTGLEWALAAVSAVSTVASMDQAASARSYQRRAQSEQKAQNADQAAAEKRKQLREERIRRARVMQGASNTGVLGSSGEMGALGALSTQLITNLGFNQGMIESSNRISDNLQSSATRMGNAQTYSDVGRLTNSIFQMSSMFPSGSSTTNTLPNTDDRPNRAGQ